MTQYGFDADGFHEIPRDWRYWLRRDAGAWWVRSYDEAWRRYNFHRKKKTPQTSFREQLPRDLEMEWRHLKAEAAFVLMLQARGESIFLEDMNWGALTPEARERSRQGNVLPGISIYAPEDPSDGVIVRKDEAEQYPDVLVVLVTEHRRGQVKEYYRARGYRSTAWIFEHGSNYGPRGTRLRHPDDRVVPRKYLQDMDTLLGVPA